MNSLHVSAGSAQSGFEHGRKLFRDLRGAIYLWHEKQKTRPQAKTIRKSWFDLPLE